MSVTCRSGGLYHVVIYSIGVSFMLLPGGNTKNDIKEQIPASGIRRKQTKIRFEWKINWNFITSFAFRLKWNLKRKAFTP